MPQILGKAVGKNDWGITLDGKPQDNRAAGFVDHAPGRDGGFDALFKDFPYISIYITGVSGADKEEWRREQWDLVPAALETKERALEVMKNDKGFFMFDDPVPQFWRTDPAFCCAAPPSSRIAAWTPWGWPGYWKNYKIWPENEPLTAVMPSNPAADEQTIIVRPITSSRLFLGVGLTLPCPPRG